MIGQNEQVKVKVSHRLAFVHFLLYNKAMYLVNQAQGHLVY